MYLAANTALDGFNTTSGGANYLEVEGGSVTFTFASPVQDFGAYFTGIQPYYFQDVITFNDGTVKTVNIPAGTSTNGGVSFAGFLDPGALISSVTINAGTLAANGGADFIGIDDVRFGPVANVSATPEGNSLFLLSMGLLPLGGLGLYRRLRKFQVA